MAGPARKLRNLIQSRPRPAVRTELPTFDSSTRIKTLERSEPSEFFFGTTEMNYVCAIVARTTFPNPRKSRRTEPALSASAINDQRMSVLWNQSKLFIKCILTTFRDDFAPPCFCYDGCSRSSCPRRRRDVAVHQSAAQAIKGKVSIRTHSAVA